MAFSTTVPILSGLAILATMTGVTLGRSAVAEINPIHFRPASITFYADLVPYRPAGSFDPQTSGGDYFQAETAYSADPDCAACDRHSLGFERVRDTGIDGIEDGWSASAAPEPRLAAAETVPEPAPANRQWIERYTTYTIVEEVVQPERVAVSAQEAPAQDES